MPNTSTADWIAWHRRRLMRHTPKTSTADWVVWHQRRLMRHTPKTSIADWIVWHRRRLMKHTPKTSTADWIVWHRRRLMKHTPKTLYQWPTAERGIRGTVKKPDQRTPGPTENGAVRAALRINAAETWARGSDRSPVDAPMPDKWLAATRKVF